MDAMPPHCTALQNGWWKWPSPFSGSAVILPDTIEAISYTVASKGRGSVPNYESGPEISKSGPNPDQKMA
jgi:hypothetical protein